MYFFEEYIIQGEPEKKEKSFAWQTAIGLQGVDRLKPSPYLIETAKQNIDGYITIDEVKSRIDNYYKTETVRDGNDRTEEAEWVLNGETVYYTSADSIRATLNYDFEQEKQFSYQGISPDKAVQHIIDFVSGLWQIHPFGEGNTRTTAVFIIKYLRTFGFEINNTLFAEHSWYFRNALVRANYNDYKNNIHATKEYLRLFFGNLLLDENNTLANRDLLIKPGAK